MFDKYLICEETVTNRTQDNEIVGFEMEVRLAYYRSLGLSMVEQLDLTVDDTDIPRDDIFFELRGKRFSLDDMETTYDETWEMGERATLFVRQPGGLSSGKHTIKLTEHLRISYLPFLLRGADAKVVNI